MCAQRDSENTDDSGRPPQLDYNIESWYSALGERTFETAFVPMTVDDARLFRDACQQHVDRKGAPIDDALRARLDAFEQKLAPTFERMGGSDKGVFVKMSSRSAKGSGERAAWRSLADGARAHAGDAQIRRAI